MYKGLSESNIRISLILFSCLIAFAGNVRALDQSEEDYNLKLLGKYIFFDKISDPKRMSCASCHDPATGGTGSVSGVNLHQVGITGANPHTGGGLRPPTNVYASFIDPFDLCTARNGSVPCGGNFWDGRAEGRNAEDGGALFPASATKHVGVEVFQGITDTDILNYAKYFGPTTDQAINPMPNLVEQNIQRQAACEHMAAEKYAQLYELAWGEKIDCSDTPVSTTGSDVANETKFDISFKRLMLAVGAWQHSADLNSFSSKRDMALNAELACLQGSVDADPGVCDHDDFQNSPGEFPLVGLTAQENLGHDLFYNVSGASRANCRFCHTSGNRNGTTPSERFTDDRYRNIGSPFNPEIPNSDPANPPAGLAGHTGDTAHLGQHKTPTLRNVDKRKDADFIKAYTHNGWFKSLESLVHFYNTADVEGDTAKSFGITRCPDDVVTEKDALANNCWPAPEVEENTSIGGSVGDLGLSLEEEAALVAFLKTFTDTATTKQPKPYK